MTAGSSPARARSASRSSRTCRRRVSCWCRSAAAGWQAVSRPRSRPAPDVRVVGVEPELAADARDRWQPDRSSVGRPLTLRGRSPTAADQYGALTSALPPARTSTGSSPSVRPRSPAGVRLAAERSRLVVEPSGALTIAALTFHRAGWAATAVETSWPSRAVATSTRSPTALTSRRRSRLSVESALVARGVFALAREAVGQTALADPDLGRLRRRPGSSRAASRPSARDQPTRIAIVAVRNRRSPRPT